MPAPQHLLNRAISLYKAGDCESAQRLLRGVLNSDPKNQDAWIWFAETYSDRDEKMRVLEKALAQNPNMAQVWRVYQKLQAAPKPKPTVMPQDVAVMPNILIRPAPRPQSSVPHRKDIRAQEVQRPQEAVRPQPAFIPHTASRPAVAETPRERGLLIALTVGMFLLLLAGSLFFFSQTALLEAHTTAVEQENIRLETDYNNTLLNLQQAQASFTALKDEFSRVTAAHLDLKGQFDALSGEFAKLTGIYQDIKNQFDSLNQAHAALTQQHTALQEQHNTLINNYNVLNEQHGTLQGQYNTLINDYNGLVQRSNDLQYSYNLLLVSYEELANKAVLPPYITVQGRELTLAFYSDTQGLQNWKFQFDQLEDEIVRGSTHRTFFSPFEGLNLKMDDGRSYPTVDFRPYVDAKPFAGYIPNLYNASASDEAFISEVWHLVSQLNTYTSDSNNIETPRFPLETLLGGGGDCEDSAILFASMIKAAPVDWKVSLVYLNSDHPLDRSKPNHVMVQVKTGYQTFLVETTSSTVMQPFAQVDGWVLDIP